MCEGGDHGRIKAQLAIVLGNAEGAEATQLDSLEQWLLDSNKALKQQVGGAMRGGSVLTARAGQVIDLEGKGKEREVREGRARGRVRGA